MTTDPGAGPPSSGPPEFVPSEAGATGGESTSDLLQSMLSRAVEDQIVDQRELTGAVNDMRTQLMRVSQELAEMRVRPAQDDVSEAQINNVTAEMREAVRFLSERLDGVTRMVSQRGEELADIRTALTAIDAHVRSQAETIGVLSAGLQALPSYGERVSVLQDNLQVLHRQLVGIEEALAAPAEDIQMGKRLTSIESSVGPLTASLASVQSSIAPLAENLASVQSSISPLTDRLNEVGEVATAQSALLNQLQHTATQLQQAVAGLHERVDPIASDITAIGSGVTGLVEGSADGAALDSRISDSVSTAVSATEERLMAHIDEAVMALAQTLLKRRPTTVATEITPTPVLSEPSVADVPAVDDHPAEAPAVEVATVEQETAAEPAIDEPTVDEPAVEELAASLPAYAAGEPSAWWEREIAPASDASEAAEAAPDGAESADEPVTEQWSSSAPGQDPPDPEPPSAALAPEEPTTIAGDEPTGPPVGADVTDAAAPAELALPAPVAPPVPAAVPWSPQTPPERDPADPTVSLDEGKKKRRWGRH